MWYRPVLVLEDGTLLYVSLFLYFFFLSLFIVRPSYNLFHYKHYVLGSKLSFLTSPLDTSYISLNSLNANVECRGWSHDDLLVSIKQLYELSYIHLGSLSLSLSLFGENTQLY